MKYLVLIILAMFFISCGDEELSLNDKIKGSWKTKNFESFLRNKPLIFSFYDSTCKNIHPWSERRMYWLDGDTLIIQEEVLDEVSGFEDIKIECKYLIIDAKEDSLTLKAITPDTKKLFKNIKGFNSNKIQLTKIQEKFDWDVQRIAFYSTFCEGPCPSMYLEIDNAGNLFFYGKGNTEKEGYYYGVLGSNEFKKLKAQVNTVALDTLQEMYAANWTCDQTCGVLIKTNDTTYESNAYGFYKEPIELRILYHSLMDIYKNVELTKDSNVKNKFKFNEFQYNKYNYRRPSTPIPSPPTLNEKLNFKEFIDDQYLQ